MLGQTQLSVCAKRNLVHLCREMRNDDLAALEMMLTFGQMMLCLAAQMKNPRSKERGFLAPTVGLEPTTRTLAVPDSVCGGHAALPIVDRGANPCSLYLAPRALASVAVNSRHAAVNTEWQYKLNNRTKKGRHAQACLPFLAPTVGLEPTTLRLTAACSAS